MKELIQLISEMATEAGMPITKVLSSPLPSGTDLHWQLPPLCSGRFTEGGAPIENYWNYVEWSGFVDFQAWYDFTVRELLLGRPANYAPYKFGYRNCPIKTSSKARTLYSMPEGWPNHSPHAACMFAVEAVDHVRHVLLGSTVVATEDTYILYHRGSPIMGVLEGVPYSKTFDTSPCLDMTIPVMRSMFRGKAIPDSSGTPVQKVRAWAMNNPGKFEDFEKMDILLQGYYFGFWKAQAALSAPLISRAHSQDRNSKRREVFKGVIDGFEELGPNDKSRIAQALIRLTPSLVAQKTFLDSVYNLTGSTPICLPVQTMDRVRASLFQLYTEFCNEHRMKP